MDEHHGRDAPLDCTACAATAPVDRQRRFWASFGGAAAIGTSHACRRQRLLQPVRLAPATQRIFLPGLWPVLRRHGNGMSDRPAPVDLPRPLLALSVLANPTDLARFDESRVWREIEEALRPLATCGSVVLERLAQPTENALRLCLSQRPWHVVHF